MLLRNNNNNKYIANLPHGGSSRKVLVKSQSITCEAKYDDFLLGRYVKLSLLRGGRPSGYGALWSLDSGPLWTVDRVVVT